MLELRCQEAWSSPNRETVDISTLVHQQGRLGDWLTLAPADSRPSTCPAPSCQLLHRLAVSHSHGPSLCWSL